MSACGVKSDTFCSCACAAGTSAIFSAQKRLGVNSRVNNRTVLSERPVPSMANVVATITPPVGRDKAPAARRQCTCRYKRYQIERRRHHGNTERTYGG